MKSLYQVNPVSSRINLLLISFLISKQARLNAEFKSVVVCIKLLSVLIPWALVVVECLQRAEATRHRHLDYSKKERRRQPVIGW